MTPSNEWNHDEEKTLRIGNSTYIVKVDPRVSHLAKDKNGGEVWGYTKQPVETDDDDICWLIPEGADTVRLAVFDAVFERVHWHHSVVELTPFVQGTGNQVDGQVRRLLREIDAQMEVLRGQFDLVAGLQDEIKRKLGLQAYPIRKRPGKPHNPPKTR